METPSRKGIGGPKTPEGRARSALNAVKHGLTAQSPVALHHESEAEWQSHREGILQSLAPVGRLEQDLAEKIALVLWRQARVAAYETLRTNQRLEGAVPHVEGCLSAHSSPEEVERALRRALIDRLLPDEAELRRLQRYESHLGRELSRYFKHLYQLQELRRRQAPAEDATLPVAAPAASPEGVVCKTNSPSALLSREHTRQAAPFAASGRLVSSEPPRQSSFGVPSAPFVCLEAVPPPEWSMERPDSPLGSAHPLRINGV